MIYVEKNRFAILVLNIRKVGDTKGFCPKILSSTLDKEKRICV